MLIDANDLRRLGFFVNFDSIMRPRSSTDASLPKIFVSIEPGQLIDEKSLISSVDDPPEGEVGFTALASSAIQSEDVGWGEGYAKALG